jgi:AbrB family looped-hinge helix DNA binding protein
MRTTIDSAGRIVIPRSLRERVGMIGQGEVEIEVDGAAIRVEPIAGEGLVDEDGLLVIPAIGMPITNDMVRELRDAERR